MVCVAAGLKTVFPGWSWLEGNFALMDIMCHELSHLTELGHGKKFLKLYLKYLSQMAESIISGEFYRRFLRL